MKFWFRRAKEWTCLKIRKVNIGGGGTRDVTEHKREVLEQEFDRNASQSRWEIREMLICKSISQKDAKDVRNPILTGEKRS